MNYVVLVGAILVFFGYLLFFISNLILIGLTGTSPTREQIVIVADIGSGGEIVVGTGFLVALLGLAVKR